jgi:transposase
MRPYSTDLRTRIVAALSEGQTSSQVAQRFGVSLPTVVRYRRLQRTQDSLAPKPLPGRKPSLNGDEQERLRQLFASRTDWTVRTLRDAWQQQAGKAVCFSGFHRWMQRLGLSYKKSAG